MRFIPTTASKVDTLKKKAKALQRNGGGQYAKLLDRAARAAGYEHWHHVTLCFRETEGIGLDRSLAGTIDQVVRAELNGEVILIGTGSEASTSQPFVAFSTGIGDAWLLDPIQHQACCLVWRGERLSQEIEEDAHHLVIGWDGHYELRGAFFEVVTEHPAIGRRAIGGYPTDALRAYLLPAQPTEESILQVIDQTDAVPLTPDVMAQLMRNGWERDRLDAAARHGARYSPSRNTVVFPPVSSVASFR